MRLVAIRTVPLAGAGAGATGALCVGRGDLWGSSNANKIAENPVTRNWGITMKMLWIPYLKDGVKIRPGIPYINGMKANEYAPK